MTRVSSDPEDDPRSPVTSTVSDVSSLVAEHLATFVAARRQSLAGLGPDLVPFADAAERAVSGGKRLRALFCHAGWMAAGGDAGDHRVAWAAGSLEWLQASALVHDDVMDGSDVRRGNPSAHRAFEQSHRDSGWTSNAEQFGVGGAILLGDLLLSWSDEMFRSCGLDQDALERASAYLDACKSEVVAGQYLDLVGQARGTNSVADAMRIVRYKAAKYTVERPLHIGAALAAGAPGLIDALSAFGLPLGEAFQLRDDVLGVFGDPAVTGKPAGDDLREGKRTVLIARAAERTTPAESALLERFLGDPTMTPQTVDSLREILVSTGALSQVERDINALENQAEAALATAPVASESARDTLRELAHRSTRRTS